ncbi:MAG: alpha/beta hydrolase [Acidimicrobiales bacterium]
MLAGAVFGEGDVGIVLAHMRGRDKTTWYAFARNAAQAGYRALAFDFRGYGESTGERDTDLDVDLIAAVEYLRSEGITSTVVMGASMGATATVNVASRLELAAAVSLSAPGEFLGLPAIDVADDISEPLLLVVAENDQPYADAAVEIDARAPITQLQMFAGNAHGTNLFAEYDTQLTMLLLDFVSARAG